MKSLDNEPKPRVRTRMPLPRPLTNCITGTIPTNLGESIEDMQAIER